MQRRSRNPAAREPLEAISDPRPGTGPRVANGEVIVRLDAHAEYPPDYIRQCVEALDTPGVGCVGGSQKAVGTASWARAIAAAVGSPFGTGGARYRGSGQTSLVDTVWLGCRRRARDAAGFRRGSDEAWIVNEDYELNIRLRKSGLSVMFSDAIYGSTARARLFRSSRASTRATV